MKRKILLLLAVLILAVSLLGIANAESVKTSISLSQSKMTEPGTVLASITVTNGGEELPGAVVLYDPAGNVVTGFGDGGSVNLDPGASKTWSGVWNVTQDQLEAGQVSFSVRYPYFDEKSGEIVYRTELVSAAIAYETSRTEMNVSRKITPTIAREGQTVSVVYTITNTGTIGLSNIRIKENDSISGTSQSIESLPAGESRQVTFSATMGNKALTSGATITYKATGTTKTLTYTETNATVSYGEAALSAKLAADRTGVTVGEKINLTLTLTATGNMSYSNVTVTDPALGEVFTGESIEAGKTLTLSRELTMQESAKYEFTVSATDQSGTEQTLLAEPVAITVVDPNKKLSLSLTLSSNKNTIQTQPADARFTLVVTNTGEQDATKVKIQHGGTDIATISSLPAGQSRTVVRDFSLSMPGTFQMSATATDALGETLTFLSNALYIAYSAATPVPTTIPAPTVAPVVLDDTPTLADMGTGFSTAKNIMVWVYYGALALMALTLILILVGLIARLARKIRSAKALDVLEMANHRDYTEEASEKEETAKPEEEKKEEPAKDTPKIEDEIEAIELPHMKYVRHVEENKDAAATPAPAASTNEDGAYKLTMDKSEKL